MKKIPCSVLIICQNSENSIRRCLDSLIDFTEVIVIDGGSTDKTLEICSAYNNVKLYINPWPGFIEQRNFSIQKATEKWSFMIDSDESITADLSWEIEKIVKNEKVEFPMYSVMRTEYFLGNPIEYGFGASSWQERLFITNRVQYTGGVHHEHLIDGIHQDQCREKIGFLNKNLRVLHDINYGLVEWTTKLPRFAILRATEKIKKNPNRKVGAFEVFFTFIGTFFKIYLKSYKNGRVGIIISFTTAINRCLSKLIMYENYRFGFDKQKIELTKRLG